MRKLKRDACPSILTNKTKSSLEIKSGKSTKSYRTPPKKRFKQENNKSRPSRPNNLLKEEESSNESICPNYSLIPGCENDFKNDQQDLRIKLEVESKAPPPHLWMQATEECEDGSTRTVATQSWEPPSSLTETQELRQKIKVLEDRLRQRDCKIVYLESLTVTRGKIADKPVGKPALKSKVDVNETQTEVIYQRDTHSDVEGEGSGSAADPSDYLETEVIYPEDVDEDDKSEEEELDDSLNQNRKESANMVVLYPENTLPSTKCAVPRFSVVRFQHLK
uniref:Uncharacterized protein n=1 Tax=Timema cristinae TaxID=61476 RepID=A0A7R9CJZ0_TIMCR|nr:unnamed protein product [Timema cristinae]